MLHRAAALTAVLVLSTATAVSAVEVKLTVADDAQTARTAGIVTSGVPFARGAVKDVKALSVTASGSVVPAQFTRLASWYDGSVRWALMDCQADVPAGGRTDLVIRDDGRNRPPAAPVTVRTAAGEVTITTGPLTLTIDTRRFNLITSLKVDGRERITGAGRGLVLYTADGKAVTAGPPTTVTVEQAGPVRAVVCLKGAYPGVHNGLLTYTARITAFAGRKAVKVHVWLENNGRHGYTPRDKPARPEWFAFDGMAVDLGLGLGDAVRATCEDTTAVGRFKVFQKCKFTQKSYDSEYRFKDLEYTITSGDAVLKRGRNTDGVVTLSGDGGTLTTAVRHFWQNYEKAIELDGTTLKLWLWPTEGQYPRRFIHHPCPGYATKAMNPLRKKGLYNLPGSVHKGYECVLDFSGRSADETSAALSRPLFALAPAAYYAATEAAPGLFTPPDVRTEDDECNAKLDAWMRMTRSVADPESPSSIRHARRDPALQRRLWTTGFWYGWMDFGDFAVPGSGGVSLHYDWPWIAMVNAARTGDLHFLRLATEMMRHRTEVDQQWSDRALEQCRGFARPGSTYAQFHCARFTGPHPSVGGTWLPGIVLYYMMTGDPKTKECIDRSSQAILAAWKRMAASDDYYVKRSLGDMQMCARSIFACCAMHGLTADRKWLDEALAIFHKYVLAKATEYGPHLHERQQIRSQGYTRDDIKYCYSIQAFCLLHHLTGDKQVFDLLKAGCDAEFPENFFDAPLFLADLHAYVAAVTGNDEYLDDAVEYWVQAFPESKCPPVYLSNNSQWSRRKAMFLRTGHLLQWAHWKGRKSDKG